MWERIMKKLLLVFCVLLVLAFASIAVLIACRNSWIWAHIKNYIEAPYRLQTLVFIIIYLLPTLLLSRLFNEQRNNNEKSMEDKVICICFYSLLAIYVAFIIEAFAMKDYIANFY